MVKQKENMRQMRNSNPSSESTWCVLTMPTPRPAGNSRMQLDSYHDTHEEALALANEIIASHVNGEIPFVFVCKIHEQNGDE